MYCVHQGHSYLVLWLFMLLTTLHTGAAFAVICTMAPCTCTAANFSLPPANFEPVSIRQIQAECPLCPPPIFGNFSAAPLVAGNLLPECPLLIDAFPAALPAAGNSPEESPLLFGEFPVKIPVMGKSSEGFPPLLGDCQVTSPVTWRSAKDHPPFSSERCSLQFCWVATIWFGFQAESDCSRQESVFYFAISSFSACLALGYWLLLTLIHFSCVCRREGTWWKG